jgi:hypothetical protein
VSAEPIVGLVLAALVIGVAGWLGWRRPTILLAVALAPLSVRPRLFASGAPVGYEWGLHHTLLSWRSSPMRYADPRAERSVRVLRSAAFGPEMRAG